MREARTFADRLQVALKHRSMSKAELARRAGLCQSAVNNWIGGQRSWPITTTAADVAEVLEVSLDWLCGLTDEEPDWYAPPAQEGTD